MNFSRLALAALVAWIVDLAYGFIVYVEVLGGQFGAYPNVFRSQDSMNLPLLFAGLLLADFALAYIYAKGYEGGRGIQEGIRFGIVVGFFELGLVGIGNYVTLNIGRRLALATSVGGFFEAIVVCAVIGLVYKPHPALSRRAATAL